MQVSKKYFDIEIDENDNIKGDYKIRDGVSKKHMALKLLKKKGFDATIIADAEYLYNFLEKKDIEDKKEVILEDKKEIILEDKKEIILEDKKEKEEAAF